MTSHEKEIKINSWLEQCNLEFLVIQGMGGSGKTTLAKYIYNSNWKKFEFASFLEDISLGETTLAKLQEQLLKDISGGGKRKIPSVSQGTPKIEQALEMNRALIVLDDLTDRSQLVKLLGTSKINSKSKIVVTTRENTDNWFASSCWRYQKYDMKLLNDDESLELLCHHAFRAKKPVVDLEEIVKRTVKYCEGHPMTLEVFGSSIMHDCYSKKTWECQMRLFESNMDSRLHDVLLRSYESLPFDTVKQLFLHIACFFNGIDKDYAEKILEPDYQATSGISTLIQKGLLSVPPNKTLKIHRLFQEMGKHIVRQESMNLPAQRSRVWLSNDSHMILRRGKGSNKVQGLTLDMKMLGDDFAFKSSALKTDAFKKMEILKLLQLNFVELGGSYEHVSENLRWLCWHGFHLNTIPSDLYMGNLVAIDMSYSNLEVFETPKDIQCLKILNLKDSHNLREIRNINRIQKLESLILWNCYSLVNVCKTIGGLTSLSLLNTTGCKNLYNRKQIDLSSASTSGGVVREQHTFSFPVSLHRLFLKDCHLTHTHILPLSFRDQPFLQYLNLGSSLLESLPSYDHLKRLRVLDLSFCTRLTCLIDLPNTLAELYIYGCDLLKKIAFQSHRFTLQEFGYKGCINLYEVEGFFKLVPIAKLDETDLGHMKWLQEYQNHEVCLVGDDELIAGRSRHIQMLYEFDIMSTTMPDIRDPNMTPEYISESGSLSFDVPSCPKNKRLKGLNVGFKYSMFGEDWAWFCKISTIIGVVDWMYNPKVIGKSEVGEVCMWISYLPIGSILDIGDTVNVSIVVIFGVEVLECGVSLVYSNQETLENDKGCIEILGGDLSGFELSTRGYYLCRRDYFDLMEVDRLTHDWFRSLVGDTIDNTEIRGWRKTGRPKRVNDPSFTELKTIRCIIHGPQLEDIYEFEDMPESSFADKTLAFTSSLLEGEITNEAMKTVGDISFDGDISTFDDITLKESDSYSPGRKMKSAKRAKNHLHQL
ncbi:disease resistance protein Roq1-like isoform X2 [Bidens hawaiensis]|uniref:disease resistance protein Roq1-like isoform X2 n=1 Tax=Bidens hawaiensis TaxID=980011 RepID=UPI004049E10C